MSTVATIVAVLALAGAAASWVIGAVAYVRTLRSVGASEGASTLAIAAFAWPFALKRLKGAAAEQAARVNKAVVAFFACVTIGVAAFSIAANLARISR